MPHKSDHVVVDVEIQKTIEETPGGWNATDQLGVACACVWEYRGERMRVYGPDDVDGLKERLLKADRITGYNIFNFDFPVIWGFSKSYWINNERECVLIKDELALKTNDLLRRIWLAMSLNPDKFAPQTHGGWPLGMVTQWTIGADKIGNGAEAPRWWQQGLVHKVVNYCADDVALERDLSDFIDRYGYVHNGRQRVDLTDKRRPRS